MTLVVLPDPPSDGETADASDVNDQDNAIVAVVNGNLDDSNISSLSGTKITAGTIPATAMSASANLGWQALTGTFTSPTYLGNRSYSFTTSVDQSAIVSNGMRLKLTRTVTAPIQCTSLNGTTQYYSKSSPSGTTFTDDFVVSAWIKLTAYNISAAQTLISRYNGTSGWELDVNVNGQIQLVGFNAGAANYSLVNSYQAIPLNKWVHVASQLDMSTFTATTTTSYIMIDGIDVPSTVARGGTNPTALVQAGNLNIGTRNGGADQFFSGKIAQAAVYSAKVTQANVRTTISQGLAGTETSLISAYSFNNSINDLNTSNANNLTANGSAVATNADSPFTQNGAATPGGSLDYAIVTAVTSSTITCQVPEGCAIPTSGGISAVSYSTQKAPFGFPGQSDRWALTSRLKMGITVTSNASYGSFGGGAFALTVPIGSWNIGWESGAYNSSNTVSVKYNLSASSLTGLATTANTEYAAEILSPSAAVVSSYMHVRGQETLTSQSTFVMYTIGATTSSGLTADISRCQIYAEFAYL